MILIITNSEDIHTNRVAEIFNNKNVDFLRLNTDTLLIDYEFTYQFDELKSFFKIRNVHSGIELTSEKLGAVWERRISKVSILKSEIDEEVDQFYKDEATHFFNFLRFSFQKYYAIGNSLYDRQAESKILQKIVAKKSGFNIPNTIFSNSASDLKSFMSKSEDLCIKPIYTYGLTYSDNQYEFFTKKFDNSLSFNDESLSSTVVFLQEYVEKQYELRVTYVGEKGFSCRINSQKMPVDKGALDWRQGYDFEIEHEIHELPLTIQKKCELYMKHLKLNFGCFDFIVDENNNYTFLECNPNGQYMWIEEELKLDISREIADFLINYDKVVLKSKFLS